MKKHSSSAPGSQGLPEELTSRGTFMPVALLRICGDPDAALMLAQACYWSKRTNGTGPWFFKRRWEWFCELGLGRRRQEAARKRLRELGFIEECLRGVPAKLYFHVNLDAIKDALTINDLSVLDTLPATDVLTSWYKAYQKDGTERASKLARNEPSISESTADSTPKTTPTPPLKACSSPIMNATPITAAPSTEEKQGQTVAKISQAGDDPRSLAKIPPHREEDRCSLAKISDPGSRVPRGEDELLYRCRLAFWRATGRKFCPSKSWRLLSKLQELVRKNSRGAVLRAVSIFGEEVAGHENIRMPIAVFLSQSEGYVDLAYKTNEVNDEIEWEDVKHAACKKFKDEFDKEFNKADQRSMENSAEYDRKYIQEFYPRWESLREKLHREYEEKARRRLEDKLEREFLRFDLDRKRDEQAA